MKSWRIRKIKYKIRKIQRNGIIGRKEESILGKLEILRKSKK